MGLFLTCLVCAITAHAQTDSFEKAPVQLKEIFIQSTASVPDFKQIRQSGNIQKGTDNILESVNGIQMIRRGNYAWEATMRGFKDGQINQTIDGMSIFGACTDKMDPISSYIEPANLKSIDIHFGGGNISGNSIGGNIDYKIRQPQFGMSKRISGLAGAGYQSNGNGRQILSSINYSGEKFALNINGIYKKSDNYRASAGKEITYSQYEKWNAGISAKYAFNPHQSVIVNYIHDDANHVGYPALLMDVAFARADIFSIALQQHFSAGKISNVETKFYFNTIHHAMDDTHRPESEVPVHMDMPGRSITKGFYSQQKLQFGNHHLSTKISGYHNLLHADMTMYPKEGTPMYMLTIPDAQRYYLEFQTADRIAFGDKLEFNSSVNLAYVRSSLYSEAGKKMADGVLKAPQVTAGPLGSVYLNPVYRFDSSLTAFMQVAFSMRSPTLQEMYGIYLFNRADGFDYIGNPYSKNEQSLNFSAGARFKNKRFTASTKGYYYSIFNYIMGVYNKDLSVMTVGAKGVKQYQNSYAQIMGGELEGSVRIGKNFLFKTQSAFNYGIDADHDALPLMAPFKNISFLSFDSRKYGCEVAGIFSAAQAHTNFDKYGETSSSGYWLLNISAHHVLSFNKTTMRLNLAIENVFDKEYYDHLDVSKILRMGRNINVQCTFFF